MSTATVIGFCFAMLILISVLSPIQSKINITLGGVFDIDTELESESSANMIPAVQMAIEHINNDPDILKDYHINLQMKDVKCSDTDAIRALVDFIREKPTKLMIIGPGCSKSAEPFAKAAHFYNLVQVSMATANPALSCKKIYPTFIRTVPPEHYQNMGRVGLIQHFGWSKVAIVQQSLDTYLGLSNDLIKRLKKADIHIITHEIFKDNEATLAIENVKRKDARILFGMFRETTARQVLCQAYKQGLHGSKYVWILMSGGYHQKWWTVNDTSCTPEQVKQALGNYFGTRAKLLDGNQGNTVAKRTVKQLEDEYLQKVLQSYKEPNIYASFAYDAVWAAALGLNSSIKEIKEHNETKGLGLEHFTYSNNLMGYIFLENVEYAVFNGMSGKVIFDEKYERLGTLQLEQLQTDDMANIGSFCMVKKVLKLSKNNPPKWQGNGIPVSHAEKIRTHHHIEKGVFYFMSSFCIVGIILAIGFLIFNIKYSNVRYIKMSSPRLNNIILTGCILIYASGIIAGIDGQFVSDKTQGIICQVQAWMVSIGFTLAFGALFSKTWRVHKIFLNKTERKVIKDHQLFGLVLAFMVIDVIILSCWQAIDPMYVTLIDMMPETLRNGDAILLPRYSHCTSNHLTVWAGILYGYKGFLLIFGTYLAWETRKVSIAVLNDSKTIGISIYNVVVPCILVIPVLHVIKENVSIVYGMTSLLCVLCTTVTQCLIFIPKVIYMFSKNSDKDDASNFSTIPKKQPSSQDAPSFESTCSSTTSVISAREDAYCFKPKDEPLSKAENGSVEKKDTNNA